MCNSNFVKFAKNGASYNISPLVKNVQWCDFYSKFVEKNDFFRFYHVTPPYPVGGGKRKECRD